MFPKLLEFGAFTLPTYGVLIGLGFLAGLSVASRLARRSGLDPERLTAMAVVLLISAIVGAKVFMFVDNWSYYAADPGRLITLSALRSAECSTAACSPPWSCPISTPGATACRGSPRRTRWHRDSRSDMGSEKWDASLRVLLGTGIARLVGGDFHRSGGSRLHGRAAERVAASHAALPRRSAVLRSGSFYCGSSCAPTPRAPSSGATSSSTPASVSVSSSSGTTAREPRSSVTPSAARRWWRWGW